MNDLEPGLASLRTWSQVARGAIGVFLLIMLLLVAAYVVILFTELTRERTGTSLLNPVFAYVLVGTNLLLAGFFLIAAVPIAGWIYRAHANLREAGAAELRYSPGWSVGSFLVPLVNFVVPFRAMRELHNRSHGEGPWQAESPVPDVTSWWSCHIAAVVISGVPLMIALISTIPGFYVLQPPGVNTGLVLFSLLLLTGSAVFLFRTIGAVTRAQRDRQHLNHADVFA